MLDDFVSEHCVLAVEVPTLECIDIKTFENLENVNNPMYRFRPPYPRSQYDEKEMKHKIVECCNSSIECVHEAHDLCRRKATEVLLFLLTDTDREYSKTKSNAIPIAFALKGKSLKVSICRQMMSDVRNYLHRKKINVLVEAYDGQWAGLVFRNGQNEPLTLFEVQRDAWTKFATSAKDKLITFLGTISLNPKEELKHLSTLRNLSEGLLQHGNMRIRMAYHTKETRVLIHSAHYETFLEVESFCNDMQCEGGLSSIHFPTVNERPDLWEICLCDRNLLHLFGIRKLHTALHQADKNFLSTDCGHIRNILLTSHQHVLVEILFSLLSGKRPDKWSHFDTQELYDSVFMSSQKIYEELTSSEIDVILKIVQAASIKECPLHLNSKLKKLGKSNFLAFILGHTKRFLPAKRKRITLMTLRKLCENEIKRSIPENVIRVGLAHWQFKIDLDKWLDNSPVSISYKLPVKPYSFDIFSYPDISDSRSQVESRIIDPSHCLTNLRVHATTKGFFGCNPKAFVRVAEADNNILNKAFLVEPIPDKQSVPFAERIFSAKVEQTMRNNMDLKEADLVKYIRHWYEACNKRGLQLSRRIEYLVDMNNYMLSFYDPELFPMNTTHVHGLPSTTFQAILQNISTRIQLYELSEKRTYNHRAISTLAVESMFSSLSMLAANNSGIPLAANIPRYISKLTQFANIQQNPNKFVQYFHLFSNLKQLPF